MIFLFLAAGGAQLGSHVSLRRGHARRNEV